MSIPKGTALCCRSPESLPGDPEFAATVVAVEGNEITIDPAGAEPRAGSKLDVCYTDAATQRFLRVPASVRGPGEAPGTIALRITGGPEPANERGAYRVAAGSFDLKAKVGPRTASRVLDVSATGLSVEMANAPGPDIEVRIEVKGLGQSIVGRFVARRVVQVGAGPEGPVSRCGFEAVRGQAGLGDKLNELVMAAQRAHLRNRSRMGATPVPAPGVGVIGVPGPAGAEGPDGGPSMQLRLPAGRIAGRPMPVTLVDTDGQVVVARGEVLDAVRAARLSDQELEICADWFDETEDEGRERRRSRRHGCRHEIGVWLFGDDGVRSGKAEMLDISRGGVGLRMPWVAHAGALLILGIWGKGEHKSEGGWIVCRVENSAAEPETAGCRVGVRFMQTRLQQTPLPHASDLHRVIEPFRDKPGGRAVRSA